MRIVTAGPNAVRPSLFHRQGDQESLKVDLPHRAEDW